MVFIGKQLVHRRPRRFRRLLSLEDGWSAPEDPLCALGLATDSISGDGLKASNTLVSRFMGSLSERWSGAASLQVTTYIINIVDCWQRGKEFPHLEVGGKSRWEGSTSHDMINETSDIYFYRVFPTESVFLIHIYRRDSIYTGMIGCIPAWFDILADYCLVQWGPWSQQCVLFFLSRVLIP